MVFSSTVFLFLFLPIVLVVYYNPIIRNRAFRNVFLLLSSLFFYAWGEPVFVFLMIISIFVSWFIGLFLGPKKGKLLLCVGVIYHVTILFIFKYLTFSARQLNLLLNKDYSSINIVLPIGISFFSFQLMSYLFDIYYGKANLQKNPLYVGLYISLFPQLIAGPIVRYETIEQDILYRKESWEDIAFGVTRFIYGLSKKVLIADYMAVIADSIFGARVEIPVLTVWLGAISYTFQIYFDFSGYSDMAIGLGRMFGFKFEENFNYPYISRSITEFWRRWHISLSTWFRDYVYIPLGGNRVSKPRWILNLFTVWLLTGIWHGANWTFVLWGLLYFVFLIIEKTIGFKGKIPILSNIYTFLIVNFLWVIFRSNSVEFAIDYIKRMFGVGVKHLYMEFPFENLTGTVILLVIAIIGATPLYKIVIDKCKEKKLFFVEPVCIFTLFVLTIVNVVATTYSPFIYFNF